MKMASREADDRLLDMLRWRCDGHSAAAIAVHLGTSRDNVVEWIGAVRRADLRESGEPREIVMAGYWK